MRELRGKRVWVSGASGALGSALVETFLALGCEVVASARRRTRLLDMRAQLANHERLRVAENDAADPEGVEALLDGLCREQPIDIVIHCAGYYCDGPLADATDKEVALSISANLLSSAWVLRGSLRRMLPVGAGKVVLVASDRALDPMAGSAIYGATKAAVTHMVQAVQGELQGGDVRVWAVLPGMLDTPTNRGGGSEPVGTPLTVICSDVVRLLTSHVDAEAGGLLPLPLAPRAIEGASGGSK